MSVELTVEAIRSAHQLTTYIADKGAYVSLISTQVELIAEYITANTDCPEPPPKSNTLLGDRARTRSSSVAATGESSTTGQPEYPADWAIDKAAFRSDVRRFARGAKHLLKDSSYKAYAESRASQTPTSDAAESSKAPSVLPSTEETTTNGRSKQESSADTEAAEEGPGRTASRRAVNTPYPPGAYPLTIQRPRPTTQLGNRPSRLPTEDAGLSAAAVAGSERSKQTEIPPVSLPSSSSFSNCTATTSATVDSTSNDKDITENPRRQRPESTTSSATTRFLDRLHGRTQPPQRTSSQTLQHIRWSDQPNIAQDLTSVHPSRRRLISPPRQPSNMANENADAPTSDGLVPPAAQNGNELSAGQMRTIAQMIKETLRELGVGNQNNGPDPNGHQPTPDPNGRQPTPDPNPPGTPVRDPSPAATQQSRDTDGNSADYTPYTGNASWKITDIGIFWPDSTGTNDIWDKDGKTYYRDVFSFTARVQVAAQSRNATIIKQDLPICFRGAANTWWISEISDITRYGLLNHPDGATQICKALETRFRMPPSKSLAKFEKMFYTVQDARNGKSVAAFAAELVHAAKHCGHSDNEDILVLHIWKHLDLPLRLTIDEPDPGTTIEKFVAQLVKKSANWEDKYRLQYREYNNRPRNTQPYRGYQPRTQDGPDDRQKNNAYNRQDNRADNGNPNREPLGTPRRPYDQNRKYEGDRNNNNYRNNNRDNNYNNNYRPRYGNSAPPRRYDNRQYEDRRKEVRVNWADGTKDEDDRDAQHDDQYDGRQDDDRDDGHPDEAEGYLGFDDDYDAYDCHNCDATFASNNQLHDHVAEYHEEDNEPAVWHVDASLPVVSSKRLQAYSPDGLSFRFWHYATAKAFVEKPDKGDDICLDSGCTMTLVDREWLLNQDPNVRIIQSKPVTVRGIGKGSVSSEIVTIPLHLPATLPDGKSIIARLFIEAHIVDNLRAKLLLGVDNLGPEGIVLDFPNKVARLTRCREAAVKLTLAPKPNHQDRRPLYTAAGVTVPPRAEVKIPIRVRGKETLPDDRDYLFEPSNTQLTFHVHVLDHTLPFVQARNDTDKPVKLARRARLGSLQELEFTDGYHVADEAATLATTEPPRRDSQLKVIQNGQNETTLPNGVTIYHEDEETKRIFTDLVMEFEDIFTDHGGFADIPQDEWMRVPLKKDATLPKTAKIYPVGPEDRKCIDDTFDKLHAQGRMSWARTHTRSAYPVFVVWRTTYHEGKPVRKGRVVVDLRTLNKATEPDVYPAPLQSDILHGLKGAKFITVGDAMSFFYHWRSHPDDRTKMAVVTHRGQEVFNVAIMGYINSVPYVQRQIDRRLADLKEFVRVYIDDLVAHSGTRNHHVTHLRKLFQRLRELGIVLNPKKTYVGFPSVRLLGQHVSGLGLSVDEEKLKALADIEFPAKLTHLEKYLGLTSWLRQYVPWYAHRADPLQKRKTELLKEGPSKGAKRNTYTATTKVDGTSKEMAAFKDIQSVFRTQPFLVHADHLRTLFMDVDASVERGYGVMLFHVKDSWPALKTRDYTVPPPQGLVEPILFLSKTLTPAEQRYWPTELEIACLIWAVRKVRHLMEASTNTTVIYTDHEPIPGIIKATHLKMTATDRQNLRLVQAGAYLQQFRIKVIHKPGRLHLVPDALSRLPSANKAAMDADEPLEEIQDAYLTHVKEDSDVTTDGHYVETLVEMSDDFRRRLRDGYSRDSKLSHVMEVLKRNNAAKEPSKLPYELTDGILYHTRDGTRRLVIPRALHKEIFDLAHTPNHLGFDRTLGNLQDMAIRHCTTELQKYIGHCPSCQVNQTPRHKPHGQYQPIQTADVPHDTVTIDFILALPDGECDAAMSVTCKFSKRVTIIPGRSDYDAEDWAKALLNRLLLADWGIPRKIISDRDPKFLSDLWRNLFKHLDVKLLYSTAYHPQTDGQSERTNQTVQIALRHTITAMENPHNWPQELPTIAFHLNAAKSASTGHSAHKAIYGMPVNSPITALMTIPQTQAFSVRRDIALALDEAATIAKDYYDQRHQQRNFQVGDRVLLRLHRGYEIPATKITRKYNNQFAGPFRVLERIGSLAYRLELPHTMRIHPVVSVAMLEPLPQAKDPYGREHPEPPPVQPAGDDGKPIYEVEKIIDKRLSRGKTQYLVRWKGYAAKDDQWINKEDAEGSKELIQDYERAHPAKASKKQRR